MMQNNFYQSILVSQQKQGCLRVVTKYQNKFSQILSKNPEILIDRNKNLAHINFQVKYFFMTKQILKLAFGHVCGQLSTLG